MIHCNFDNFFRSKIDIFIGHWPFGYDNISFTTVMASVQKQSRLTRVFLKEQYVISVIRSHSKQKAFAEHVWRGLSEQVRVINVNYRQDRGKRRRTIGVSCEC